MLHRNSSFITDLPSVNLQPAGETLLQVHGTPARNTRLELVKSITSNNVGASRAGSFAFMKAHADEKSRTSITKTTRFQVALVRISTVKLGSLTSINVVTPVFFLDSTNLERLFTLGPRPLGDRSAMCR